MQPYRPLLDAAERGFPQIDGRRARRGWHEAVWIAG
jgi:hypothetical protein